MFKKRAVVAVSICVVIVQIALGEGPETTDVSIILGKAIAARGGKDRLAMLATSKCRLKGIVYGKDTSNFERYAGESWVQLPDRAKTVLKLETDRVTLTLLIIGADNWRSVNGVTTKLPKAFQRASEQQLMRLNIEMLYPLLADPDRFRLMTFNAGAIDGRDTLGLRVKVGADSAFDLHFDKDSGLLAKISYTMDEPGVPSVVREEYYSAYREFNGLRIATRVQVFVGGRKYKDAELSDFVFVKEFAPDTFSVP